MGQYRQLRENPLSPTSGWLATIQALPERHISNDLLSREFRLQGHVTLFPDRNERRNDSSG
jgi:hypothetical protein